MSIRSFLILFALIVVQTRCFGQDTLRKSTPPDTTRSKVLRTATVTRQAPLIQHQIDRITLNVDHLIAASGTNVLELIRQLPGVRVTPEGQISLNGRSGVNVLIDGKPTYLSADDLASLLNNMPSAEIQRLELMTNPPAKFDAQGTGGLINIVRKRNRATGFNGTATGTAGEGNFPRYTGSILLNYSTARYNWYVSESYNYIKTRGGRDVTADIFNGTNLLSRQMSHTNVTTASQASNTTAGIDWYLSPKTILTGKGNATIRRSNEQTGSLMTIFDKSLDSSGQTAFTALNRDHPFNYTAELQLSHRPDTAGQEWSVNADVSTFEFRPGQYNSTSGSEEQNIYLDQKRTLRIMGARADYTHPWPGKGKWEAGIKSSYVHTTNNSSYYNQAGGQDLIDSAQSDYNINTENINAAYVNIDRSYKKLSLQAGLRAEQTMMSGQQRFNDHSTLRQKYFQLFPTLYIDYKIDSRNSLNVQLGRRIDRADYHELVPFRRPLTPTLFFQGNPNLRPNLTWHSEITWAWRGSLFITVGYDVDKDYVRTFPYLDANDSTMTRIPTNVQGAHSWYGNLSYNHPITKWWTTNTTASFYRNSFTGSTSGFTLDNPGIVTLDLTSGNSLILGKNLTGEIDYEIETKRQFVQSTFGAYSILSLGLRQQLPRHKTTLSLNAHNILQSEGHYSIDRNLNLYQYSDLLFYTRYVTLTLAYHFGSGKPAQTKTHSASKSEQQRAGN
jgi:hypothetical protein